MMFIRYSYNHRSAIEGERGGGGGGGGDASVAYGTAAWCLLRTCQSVIELAGCAIDRGNDTDRRQNKSRCCQEPA